MKIDIEGISISERKEGNEVAPKFDIKDILMRSLNFSERIRNVSSD